MKHIWAPVLLIFPLAFMVIGLFMNSEEERAINQHKIKEAESLYRTTLYSIGDAVITTNNEGNVQQMNRIAESLTGWTEQTARNKPLNEVFHIINAFSRDTVINPVQKVLKKGKIMGLANHTILISKDGREYQIADSAAPIKDDHNAITGVVLVFQDVTQTYQIQEKIRHSEEKLAEAQQIAQLGHYTFNIKKGYWSNSEELNNIFGITKAYKKDIEGWLHIVHPDHRETMREYLLTNVLQNHELFDKEYMIINQQTGAQKWVHGFGKLKCDEANNPVEMFGTIQDITARKKAEEKLHFQSRLLSLIEEAIIVTDLKGMIRYWNPYAEKLYGWKEEDVLGQSIMDVTVPELSYEEGRRIMERLNKGQGWSDEFIVRHKDGSTFPCKVTNTPVYDQHGTLTGIIGLSSDITERKEFELKLKQSNEEYQTINEELTDSLERIQKINTELAEANKKAVESDQLKTAFLANLSHEIRTPMNGILGFAGLLKDKELTTAKQERYLEVIERSGQRMLNLINDLVDISKIEAGQVQVHKDLTDLNRLMDALFTFFRPEGHNKGLQLTRQNGLPDNQSHISTDKTKLEQVLSNLLKNALKFTNNGHIAFGYECKKDMLHFWVSDTGPGIHEEFHKNIFDRFRQVEQSPMREHEGSGLGLAISKAFIELMNGKIWVESEPGQGSTFRFTIPYHPANPEMPAPGSTNRKKFDSNITVLVAEDDQSSYLFLREVLNSWNIKTIHAHNGKIALETLKQHPDIKLVFMDLKMPLMNGLDAISHIRKTNINIPIIAQTAYASANDKQKALETGCNDYLVKPISKQSLENIINKYL